MITTTMTIECEMGAFVSTVALRIPHHIPFGIDDLCREVFARDLSGDTHRRRLTPVTTVVGPRGRRVGVLVLNFPHFVGFPF